MNVMRYSGQTELIAIGLQPGELLLESIQQAIKDYGIENGAVISGIGTLKTCRMHYVEHTQFPPKDRFFLLQKPLELLSIDGLIADSKPHLHIMVSCGEKETYGGHLEEGCEVLYLCEIMIMVSNNLKMTRYLDENRKISLLDLKK
jgi:predicted DNA-binding protein with PD1-like motif